MTTLAQFREAMLKEGALAILRVSPLLGGPVENFRIGARAMMQQALKELPK